MPVFLEPPFNENSDENKNLRKYAALLRPTLTTNQTYRCTMSTLMLMDSHSSWGESPFDMHPSADALEKLSRGCHDDSLVDVSWLEPYHSETTCQFCRGLLSWFIIATWIARHVGIIEVPAMIGNISEIVGINLTEGNPASGSYGGAWWTVTAACASSMSWSCASLRCWVRSDAMICFHALSLHINW